MQATSQQIQELESFLREKGLTLVPRVTRMEGAGIGRYIQDIGLTVEFTPAPTHIGSTVGEATLFPAEKRKSKK